MVAGSNSCYFDLAYERMREVEGNASFPSFTRDLVDECLEEVEGNVSFPSLLFEIIQLKP